MRATSVDLHGPRRLEGEPRSRSATLFDLVQLVRPRRGAARALVPRRSMHRHTQLETRPQDTSKTDELLQELAAVGLVRIGRRVDGEHVVLIDTDALGVIGVASVVTD